MSDEPLPKRIEKNLSKINSIIDELVAIQMRDEAGKRYFAQNSNPWEIAFEIRPGEENLLSLLQTHNLSRTNPLHLRALLEAFVRAYHPRDHTFWTKKRKIELAVRAYAQIIKPRQERLTHLGLARNLRRVHKPDYNKISEQLLRKKLSEVIGKRGLDDPSTIVSRAKEADEEYYFEVWSRTPIV